MASEKRAFNSSLNSRGLEAFVSEEQARRMCATQGAHSLFIVDAHHGKLVTDEDGTQRIHLIADQVELIPVEHEDRVRSFMRALYLARPDQHGQQAFETGDGPTVDDAATGLDAAVETDETGAETGIWTPDAPAPAEVTVEDCPMAGCILPAEHDGDHESADAEEPSNVVSFSG